jgi:phosphoribosylanthranilate isomerase
LAGGGGRRTVARIRAARRDAIGCGRYDAALMTFTVKICGITSLKDAQCAVAAGADFIGLIFAPESPRRVSVATARTICRDLRGRAQTVGVFRNAPAATVANIALDTGVDLIQLHGDETPEECRAAPRPVIKAVELTAHLTAEIPRRYAGCTRYLLFDRPKGETSSDWLHFAKTFLATKKFDVPYFFAGGLTPETVANAVADLAAFGVDVASGVEDAPGVKNPDKLIAFCNAIRKESVS